MSREWAALVFAMTFPVVMAWAYFVVLARPPAPGSAGVVARRVSQAAFAGGKVVQFAFPLLWLWFVTGRLPWPEAPDGCGLIWGIGFGLLVSLSILALYYAGLRDSRLLADAPGRIHDKLRQFGLTAPAAYVLFAGFLCVIHSLLEEYYWRWFVFGRLRFFVPVGAAVAVSSLAFMAHHVIILGGFFPGKFLAAVAPFSLCVAAGGAFWAWLYQRTGSLYAPWLSHLLIDAAIMAVGYDLAFVRPANV